MVRTLAEPPFLDPHSQGAIYLSYTPDGQYCITVGSDGFVKRYKFDDSSEPAKADQNGAVITALSTSKRMFVTCNEECSATLYSIDSMTPVNTVLRSSLPMRDVVFSPDGRYIAACGDDNIVKIVEADDILNSFQLPEHPAGVRHLSFDPAGIYIATSCEDGNVRIFSLSSQNPDLKAIIPDVTPAINATGKENPDGYAYTGIAWHPTSTYGALQTKSRDIAIFRPSDSNDAWEEVLDRRFKDEEHGHTSYITCIKWSLNARYIASSDKSRLLIWDCATRKVVAQCKSPDGNITSVSWNPSKDALTFGTDMGLMFTLEKPVSDSTGGAKKFSVVSEDGGTPAAAALEENGETADRPASKAELFGEDSDMDIDDFVEDDDDGGYSEKSAKKREAAAALAAGADRGSKRSRLDDLAQIRSQPALHSGATPWRNNRRYLCLNDVGYVWAVNQDTHNTVTVTFHDKGVGTEYHFTDYTQYTMASISPEACLCANSQTASLRFHRGSQIDNWEYAVSNGDSIRAVSLSETIVAICTSNGYTRYFNLYGTPISVYRQSRDPVVAVSTHRNYVMLLRTNTIGQVTCTVENPQTDQIFVKEEPLDLAPDCSLLSAFFSDNGDPCIYDSTGVLLVLSNWREPLQSRWVPLLDTRTLSGTARDKSYWPVGVVDEQYYAIVVRGREPYPSIPMPVFEQFDIAVPTDSAATEQEKGYLTKKVLHDLYRGKYGDNEDDDDAQEEITRRVLELDKLLLQQFNVACQKHSSAKPMGIVKLLSQNNALEVARQIAIRNDQLNLAERIEDYKLKRISE